MYECMRVFMCARVSSSVYMCTYTLGYRDLIVR